MLIGLQQGALQLVSTEWPKPECAGEQPAELEGTTQRSDADASLEAQFMLIPEPILSPRRSAKATCAIAANSHDCLRLFW